jgi:hypothetical protein
MSFQLTTISSIRQSAVILDGGMGVHTATGPAVFPEYGLFARQAEIALTA